MTITSPTNPPLPSRTRMIDTAAAADYVGLAKNTLEKARVYGGGPIFAKYRRAVRYSVDELDVWIAKNSAASTSEHVNAS